MDNNISIPRMRTVAEAARELKAQDPQTCMTQYHIRRLVLDGVIPSVRAGKKILFDLNVLLDYMRDPTAEKFQQHMTAPTGRIRRVC